MVRGSVTILMLLGLVIRPMIPVSHAHAHLTPEQQVKHNAVPHVHIGSTAHSHSHESGCPAHHHDDPSVESPDASYESGVVPATGCHHDSDAFWLPITMVSKYCANAPASLSDMYAVAVTFFAVVADDGDRVQLKMASGELRGPPSKLYILLRTLRN